MLNHKTEHRNNLNKIQNILENVAPKSDEHFDCNDPYLKKHQGDKPVIFHHFLSVKFVAISLLISHYSLDME